MTREDMYSGLLLLVLSLALWFFGLGRVSNDPASAELPRATPVADGSLANQFGAGRSAFRLSAPASWSWTEASIAGAEVGWTPIGAFAGGEASLQVNWRRLEREVRVEDYLEYECRRLQLSVQCVRAAEGRRPRVTIAEIWRTEGGTRHEGLLALVKMGSRLFRLVGWSADALALREAVESFQPLGTVASSCAEPLALWRPIFRGPLSVSYPAGWSIHGTTPWGESPVLHLHSRLGGKVRGVLMVLALDPGAAAEELVGACIEDLLKALAEREREFGVMDPRLMADIDSSTAQMEGPGRFQWYRVAHLKEEWEIRVRVLSGEKCAVGIVEAGPVRECDVQAWMVNRAAFDVVCDAVKEE